MADSSGDSDRRPNEPTLFGQPTGGSHPEENNPEEGHPEEDPSGDGSSGNDGSSEDRRRWPPQERFPLNLEGTANREERAVGETVGKIYGSSEEFLAVTAFTSLEHLLSFFGETPVAGREVDIVLGSEPSGSTGGLYEGTRPIARQAREYWLRRGVSVLSGGGTARLLKAMSDGNVRFHAAENLHAKIYVGDEAAALGSSNFSRQGMRKQREANVRFEAGSGRYEELRQVAEGYLESAEERTEEIAGLLRDLLRPVTWQEALARGAAEILEGDWTDRYPEAFKLLQEENLWPHQEQAIAQGLWILETRGSVLVADATGSGKTRIGTHLLYGLLNRLWARGQASRTDATVVCPPQVTGEWDREIRRSKAAKIEPISHGMLSQGRNAETEREEVRQANVLFLDEAHNYLRRHSERSKAIASSAAGYSALLTATPINRGTSDLLRMIELLGLDNLSDREFKVYKGLRGKSNLTAEDEEKLRAIVRRCTIRRTKQDLNEVVDRRPEGYTDEDGKTHRFPKHNCRTYRTGETDGDKRLAGQINELAEELRGLRWLRQFKVPVWDLGTEGREAAYFRRRVKGASGLASHTIQRALQSSKAALLEVIYGTARAAEITGLEEGLKTGSGDYLSAAGELLSERPREESNFEAFELPGWLTSGLEKTVEEERETLREIGEAAKKLSSARTRARARKIREIAEERVLLAFGAKPLTLHALRDCLQSGAREKSNLEETGWEGPGGDGKPSRDDGTGRNGRKGGGLGREVVVADGNLSASRRRAVKEKLGLDGSEQTAIGPEGEGKEGLIALCSDAMSEGLNLQRASSVVLLDTPSVIRIAEQRVGRIDRMDSPHEEIDVWWPEDSRPFQSARRDLLIERYNANERLLGNNIDLPDTIGEEEEIFSEEGRRRASATALIEEYETHQQEGPERRLDDAFRPARELVGLASPGEREREPVVSKETYENVAGAEATVWSRVSIMKSESRWGFFCLRGREAQAPRWILLEEGGPPAGTGPLGELGQPEAQKNLTFDEGGWTDFTRLGPISRRFRALIKGAEQADGQDDPALWGEVKGPMEEMLSAIRQSERDLLSSKAQHALDLLQTLASEYNAKTGRGERAQVCKFLRSALSGGLEAPVDIQDLADRWLGLIQPRYVEWKQDQPGSKAVRLKDGDFTRHLLREPIQTEDLRRLAENTRRQEPVGRRLAAAIVALPFE